MSRFPFLRVAPGVAAALVFIVINFTANADTAGTSGPAEDPSAAAGGASAQGLGASALPPIIVTAQHLDDGRAQIQTQTGASTYTLDAAAIAATPGGDNTLLNQVVLQAPDVAQDSFGQFHVRGEHNGLQYRINGIILPEGISVFGQSLDPRLISSMSLVTGALPAEFGLRTAGIIDITTKSGIQIAGRRRIACTAAATARSSRASAMAAARGPSATSYGRFSAQRPRHRVARRQLESRSTITPRNITASATSRTSWMSRTASRSCSGSSVGKFQIPNLYGERALAGLTGQRR